MDFNVYNEDYLKNGYIKKVLQTYNNCSSPLIYYCITNTIIIRKGLSEANIRMEDIMYTRTDGIVNTEESVSTLNK